MKIKFIEIIHCNQITKYVMNGIIIKPRPAKYAENPIPIPRNWVGYNSPANGYIIKNDADIVNLENRNKTNVSITASKI